MKVIKIIVPILFLCISLMAQEANNQVVSYKDFVKLNDGSEFVGLIKHIDEKNIIITILGGHEVKISRADIKNIKQKCSDCGERAKFLANKNKKIYYQLSTGAITGNNNLGGTFTNSVGYNLNSKIGIGVGVGVQSFGDYWDRINTIPLFLEGKYFLSKNSVSPFCQVQGGYGFAKLSENAKGGLYFQPSLGVAFRKNDLLDFNISFGYVSQRMHYDYLSEDLAIYSHISSRNLILRRWVIQAGITF